MDRMILKIVIVIISLTFSFGLTLIIKPSIGDYIKSPIILNTLYIIFTIVGFCVIYKILNRNILDKKSSRS